MNSYFASVEQQANPLLRGKAVGVCSYVHKNGCVISPSIEAKAAGVKTGDRACEAKQKCPTIVFLENQPAKYRAVSERLFTLLAEYAAEIEPYSIDEAFLDLTGHAADLNAAAALGKKIKQRIKDELGEWLRCSIGLSHTRWLAKTASDLKKPDGLTILKPNDLEQIFERLTLTDLFGINVRLDKRLNALGIKTPNELRHYPATNLMQALGKPGYYLWLNVNGYETIGVDGDQTSPKSVGHSYCLPKKTTDKNYLKGVLFKLCEKTGRRLRQLELEALALSVGWAYQQGGGWHN